MMSMAHGPYPAVVIEEMSRAIQRADGGGRPSYKACAEAVQVLLNDMLRDGYFQAPQYGQSIGVCGVDGSAPD